MSKDNDSAFRLASELGFMVLFNDTDRWGIKQNVVIVRPIGGYEINLSVKQYNGDPLKAARDAIFEAADSMKGNK